MSVRYLHPLLASVLLACQSLPTGDVKNTLSDAEACGVGILATASGTPDLDGLLRCGMTVADVWNLIVKLEKAPSDGSSSALTPNVVAWHQRLEGVKVQIRSQHPEAVK